VVGPSKQANLHMHGYSAVTLVWGSLRLAPVTHVHTYIHTYNKDALIPRSLEKQIVWEQGQGSLS